MIKNSYIVWYGVCFMLFGICILLIIREFLYDLEFEMFWYNICFYKLNFYVVSVFVLNL